MRSFHLQAGFLVLVLVLSSCSAQSQGIYFSVQPPYRNGSNQADAQADAQADHSELSAPEGKQPIQQNQPMSQALPKFEIQEEKRPVANFKRKGIKNAPPFAKIPEESPHRRFHMLPSSQQPQQSVESFNGRQPNVGFNSKEGGDFFPVNKVPEKRQPIPVQASHVRKQLMQSTSKPSTEKLASHVVIWTSGQYLGAPNSDENVTNTESPCACSLREAWMDIVFALDVSDAISIQDLHALTNFLSHLAKIMRVEQGVEKSTRFAIVKFAEKASIVADFGMIVNSEVFGRKMEQIAFLHGRNNSEAGPGKVANIAAGLVAAQRLLSTQKRRNVPGVVVLFSSTDVECIKSGTSSRKRWAKTFDEDPCRVATRIKQGNNVLITVAMRFGHALTYPKMNISTPCFHAQNSRNLSSVLKKMLCQANCFCLPPFVQFTDEDQCKRSGECVYTQSFAASFTQASKTCSDYGAHLVEIFSPAKESFIRDLHLATKNIPYWIGISSNLLKPQWNSGKKVYATDYSNWDPQTKGLIEGQCAYADLLSNSEKNVVWRAEQCEDFETSYYFSCQKSACDTSQYCEINDHRPI